MSPPSDVAPRRVRRVELADGFAEAGMRFVQTVEAQAIGPGPEASGVTPQVAETFALLSRSGRSSVALGERLEVEGLGLRTEPAWPPAVKWDEPPKAWDVRRLVRSEIEYSREGREREEMFRDLEVWIREENDPDYWDRPVRDIAFEICNAMGVRPKLKKWTAEDRGAPPYEPVPYEDKHPRPMRDSYLARTPQPRPPWAAITKR